ncbi:GNAT family N-acetyltransferase [Planctomyces sp. SH-PL14]|uniref:GNAT family N-acetyltransferase n=1 Tax=Planctomyces sp. SH-PL14 TaxID=1632864 RepID=UPI00078B8257|nr:GNAT family N-acetyltransferase [Planctomyces sp. SH-PL14]AMV22172.1 Acetyltransferase (GNAT) family protein [Planctomyces sp. SH-PL14]
MNFRFATHADAPELAALNHALIRDEGHRNPMTVGQLAQRMTEFLANGYRATVFEIDESTAGYALYRFDPEWVYLRQFYVRPECRRRGIGRAALQWLRANAWTDSRRVRVEVLVGNTAGIAFWRAAGFADYCLTLELERGG